MASIFWTFPGESSGSRKVLAAVIREDSCGRFEISGHGGVCVLPHDAHRCTTLEEMVAKLDEMAAVYGWTVTGIQHRRETTSNDGVWPPLTRSVWTTIRGA